MFQFSPPNKFYNVYLLKSLPKCLPFIGHEDIYSCPNDYSTGLHYAIWWILWALWQLPQSCWGREYLLLTLSNSPPPRLQWVYLSRPAIWLVRTWEAPCRAGRPDAGHRIWQWKPSSRPNPPLPWSPSSILSRFSLLAMLVNNHIDNKLNTYHWSAASLWGSTLSGTGPAPVLTSSTSATNVLYGIFTILLVGGMCVRALGLGPYNNISVYVLEMSRYIQQS